jgi:hypothetical protein
MIVQILEEVKIFLFAQVSSLALWSSQPAVLRTVVALSLAVK